MMGADSLRNEFGIPTTVPRLDIRSRPSLEKEFPSYCITEATTRGVLPLQQRLMLQRCRRRRRRGGNSVRHFCIERAPAHLRCTWGGDAQGTERNSNHVALQAEPRPLFRLRPQLTRRTAHRRCSPALPSPESHVPRERPADLPLSLIHISEPTRPY